MSGDGVHVFRVHRAQQAAGNAAGGASAWVSSHKQILAGGAAVVGVGLFALHQRNTSAGTAATPAAQAGLTAAPGTTGTDIETWVQDALNAQNAELNRALRQRKKPKNPKTPPPVPRPGHGHYTIRHGDTLERVAQAVYGNADKSSIRALKLANPILWPFSATARLDHYAGDTIRVPAQHHKGGHHNPPPHPKKPRRGRKPKEPRPKRRRRQRQPKPPVHHQPPPPRGRFPHEPHPKHAPAPHQPRHFPHEPPPQRRR